MTARPMHRGHLLLIAIGVLAILIQLAASVDLADQDVISFVARGENGNHAGAPADAEPSSPDRTTLEDLSCFGCHDLPAHIEGEDFPHTPEHEHLHCHVCHAFQGHAETVLREEICDECH